MCIIGAVSPWRTGVWCATRISQTFASSPAEVLIGIQGFLLRGSRHQYGPKTPRRTSPPPPPPPRCPKGDFCHPFFSALACKGLQLHCLRFLALARLSPPICGLHSRRECTLTETAHPRAFFMAASGGKQKAFRRPKLFCRGCAFVASSSARTLPSSFAACSPQASARR